MAENETELSLRGYYMKNTTKIIISLCVALVIVATVLVVGLVKNSGMLEETTTKPAYSLQATTAPATVGVTESWVDLDQMASELATATDTTDPSDTTTDTTATTVAPAIQTTIVYIVYSETNVAQQTTESLTVDDDDVPEMAEYKYSVDKSTGSVTINKYLGDDSVVWIPEKISGYTVRAIGGKCFEKQSLKGVVIPETVVTIGNNAFQGCKNLSSVTFKGAPSTITVGDKAFQNCGKLKSINLPAAKRIGNLAFENCTSLEKIALEYGTEEIGDWCFSKCTSLKEVKIPESVSVVGQGAFSGEHPEDMVVYCVEGSAGHEAVKQYDIKIEFEAY